MQRSYQKPYLFAFFIFNSIINNLAAQTVNVSTATQLQNALNSAIAGQTIVLANGIYVKSGGFSVPAGRHGTAAAPITLVGTANAVLSSGTTSTGYSLGLNGNNYWRLKGFAVRNAKKGIVIDNSKYTSVQNIRATQFGEEAIHLRTYSSFDTIRGCWIDSTGLLAGSAGFGEGIYIGSADSNWATYTSGNPDTCNYNVAIQNVFGAKISAENIDIKEGTKGGYIGFNTFNGAGLSNVNSADSWIDVKGSFYTIEHNTGINTILDGFQTNIIVAGSGNYNVFSNNYFGGIISGRAIQVKLSNAIGTAANNKICLNNVVVNAALGLTNATPTDCNAKTPTTWQSLTMFGGGYITHLVMHPTAPNTLVGVCDVGGIFRTTNGSLEWSQLNASVPKKDAKDWHVRAFAYKTDQPTTMYYLAGDAPYSRGTAARFWKTTDDGATWSSSNLPFAVGGNGDARFGGTTLLVNPNNPNQIIAAGQPNFNYATNVWNGDGGVFISNNGGVSFTKINTTALDDTWVSGLRFERGNNDVIYISAVSTSINGVATPNQGLWKYIISTNNLTQLNTFEIVDFDFDAAFNTTAANAQTIIATSFSNNYVSANGGATWTNLNTPTGLQYGLCAVAHPKISGTWYFGTYRWSDNSIVTTTDAGANFYSIKYNAGSNLAKITHPAYLNTNDKPSFANYMAGIFFHPANANTVYLSDWFGVWKTNDAAQPLLNATSASNSAANSNWAWSFNAQGIHNLVQIRTSLHPTDSTRFYANVGDLHYYESTNAGATMQFNSFAYMNMTSRIDFHKKNPNIGYMVGTQEHGDIGKIYKTTNAGASWSQTAAAMFNGGAYNITDLQLTDSPDTLIIGIEKNSLPSQVYCSNDGGATWAAWDTGLSTPNIFKTWSANDKLIKDANGRTFYIWKDNLLFKRNLTDAAWTSLAVPVPANWISGLAAHPKQKNTIFLGQYTNVLYKSTNNGATWTTTATLNGGAGTFAISKQGSIAVQTWVDNIQQLELSRDNGGSWQPLGTDGFLRLIDGLAFLQNNKLLGWSQGNSGFVANLPVTTILPVEWLGFTLSARQNPNAVDLIWETGAEYNCASFDVERSANAIDFSSLSQIVANNTSQGASYKALDAHPVEGINYYRIRQNDFDGKHTYSNTQTVYFEGIEKGFSIVPNPVFSDNTLLINAAYDGFKLTILNALSQKITEIALHKNENYLSLATYNLPKGVYFFQFNDAKNTVTKKMILE